MAGSYELDVLWELAKTFSILEAPGEFEFYPSESHAIRLPFGFIPGQRHDPKAWIRFIDDYHAGRIKRHAMSALRDKLFEALGARQQSRSPGKTTTQTITAKPPPAKAAPSYMGIPKRDRPDADLAINVMRRFREIIENQKRTFQDVEDLLTLGIRLPGTRNAVLNILAAHLIWFRHLSEQDAIDFLTAWANDPRHESKDIAADIANGTQKVAKKIAKMCRWYAERKKIEPINPRHPDEDAHPKYAPAELLVLRDHVQALPADEQTNQAHFLLSFLNFAKQHGNPDDARTAWQAAPAIAKVVRRWQGCNHKKYKTRMNRAEDAGLFRMVKEKWQNPKGKGRARTYQLAVPVVAPEEWTLNYDDALLMLTAEVLPEQDAVNVSATPDKANATPVKTATSEGQATQNDEREQAHEPEYRAASHRETVVSAPVRPQGARGGLEPRPRQRDQKPTPTFSLPRQVAGGMRAVRGSADGTQRNSEHVHAARSTDKDFLMAEERAMLALNCLHDEDKALTA